jgi:hypothetical protein
MNTAAANDRADLHRHYRVLPSVRLTTCEEVISKCDSALEAKNKQIKKLELGLTTQTERVADLSSQLEDKNQELQAWYRNPFVVGALGLVAGAAVITFAK